MAQLFFKYGAMNSGKSIEILKVAHNYEEQDKPVLLFTSAIDDRDQVGYVSSRIDVKLFRFLTIHLFTKLSKVKR